MKLKQAKIHKSRDLRSIREKRLQILENQLIRIKKEIIILKQKLSIS